MPYQPTWQSQYLNSMQGYQGVVPSTGAALPFTQYQPTNELVWVNGPDSAMQVQLPPNSTSKPMFDNKVRVFYVVSTDGTGSKTLETFDYAPHVEEPAAGAVAVTREEFDALANKVDKMIGELNESHAAVPEPSAAAQHAAQPAAARQAVNVPANRPGQPQRPDAVPHALQP